MLLVELALARTMTDISHDTPGTSENDLALAVHASNVLVDMNSNPTLLRLLNT
jgi:hypothetical protein